jgi:hypothetical protein
MSNHSPSSHHKMRYLEIRELLTVEKAGGVQGGSQDGQKTLRVTQPYSDPFPAPLAHPRCCYQ